MAFDISWEAIGKLMLAGLVTYVLLPGALVLRDWVLRKIIEIFILNRKLDRQISEFVHKEGLWNEKYSKSHTTSFSGNKKSFLVGDKEVNAEEYLKFTKTQNQINEDMHSLYVKINNKSALLNWLGKHYKQEDINLVPQCLEQTRERFGVKTDKES